MSMLLPRNYLQAETKIILLEHLKLSQNLLWDKFIEIEHYYKSQHYSYLFVSYDDKAIYTSFPQLFYPLMTRQFFCDFHEKSEDFCVS